MSDEKTDVWASAPDEALIPFLTNAQRAELVNTRAALNVTGMDWDKAGRFGPCFVATFIVEKTGDAYQYSFTARPTRPTRRDITNKWMYAEIRKGNGPIPAVFCKSGNSYFLDKPGTPSDIEGGSGVSNEVATEDDNPPF